MTDSRDPNDAPTLSDVADAFWSAHSKLRDGMKKRLVAMRDAGFRGFVDVNVFFPFAPLALRRSGKEKVPPSTLMLSLYVVDDREAPLPFGWVRYEVSDEQKIRAIMRGDASQ